MSEKMDLDAPVMTRREALEKARERLGSVVNYALNCGLEPDEMDKGSIREAHEMVKLALRPDADAPGVEVSG